MMSIRDIREYRELLRQELKNIERDVPAGQCYWRTCKARIETLDWVLEEQ